MPKSPRDGAPAPRRSPKSTITPKAVARVQGAVAPQNGGGIPKGSYVGRLQRAAAKAG